MVSFLRLGCLVLIGVSSGCSFAAEVSVFRAPTQALNVSLARQEWQFLAAVSLAPVYASSAPILYNDGSGELASTIPGESLKISDLGSDAATVTAAIATKYWKTAPTVYVVETYEQALWVVPSAALATAPILVKPEEKTLKVLGTITAIVVGSFKISGAKVVPLASKQAVWDHQLALAKTKGITSDYVIVTNPNDTTDNPNENIQWPFLSLAAAPLAAYRHALVQTGDCTGDRKKLHAVGGSMGDAGDKAKYEFLKPTFQKVKDESNAAIKYLADHGGTPRYLAMVGDPISLPHYICDLHTKYKYWDIQIDFVPTDTPYGTLRNDVDFTRYVKPDVAVGRILGDNIYDESMMLARTFFRKGFLPGGKYNAGTPVGWEKKAIVYDGHRLNQPDEGGPDASPNEPFFPAGEVHGVFQTNKLASDYLVPRDETKPDSKQLSGPELFAKTSEYGFIQHVAHGDPPFMRIETGRSGKDMKNYLATGPEFRKRLKFTAPSIVYVIGCNVGTVYAPFKNNAEFLPFSAIHAGATAFMAPNKCQAICFWRFAPKGPGADQCILFWKNFLEKKQSLGVALNEAKWTSYQTWADKQTSADRGNDSDNAIEVDPPALILFGDPALTIE